MNSDRPDHQKGFENHREMHKVMEDRQAGKITKGQQSRDLAELRRRRNQAIQGRPKE